MLLYVEDTLFYHNTTIRYIRTYMVYIYIRRTNNKGFLLVVAIILDVKPSSNINPFLSGSFNFKIKLEVAALAVVLIAQTGRLMPARNTPACPIVSRNFLFVLFFTIL